MTTSFKGSYPLLDKAFTLLELILTMSVISLLAAMLLPAVNKSRESARSASCVSNLRQLGLAMQVYLSENGDYFPWGYSNNDPPPGTGRQWSYSISPYLEGTITGRTSAFLCPSRAIKQPTADVSTYSVHQAVCPDVTWTGNTITAYDPPAMSNLVLVSTMYRLSDTILMGDGIQLANANVNGSITFEDAIGSPSPIGLNFTATLATAEQPATIGLDKDSPALGSSYNFRYRHNGAVNCLFCDGHVVSMKKGTIKEKNLVPGHPPGRY